MPKRELREIRLTTRLKLDRRGAEALKMTVRRAARELGLSISDLQVRPVGKPGPAKRPARRARPRTK